MHECDGTQLEMNLCSARLRAERDVELRVTVQIMGHYLGFADELDRLQTTWETDRAQLCDHTPKGGSAQGMFYVGCIESAARQRIDALYALDIATDAPRPDELWGTTAARPGPCVQRVRGTHVGDPPRLGDVTLLDLTTVLTLDIADELVGEARGALTQRASVRTTDGRAVTASSTARLMGRRVGDTIGGVYESEDVIDGDRVTGHGYWYLLLDGAAARGEIVSLAGPDARLALAGALASPCG